MGLEPTTSSLGSWHSTIELRPLTSNDNSNRNSNRRGFRSNEPIGGEERRSWDRCGTEFTQERAMRFLRKTGVDEDFGPAILALGS